MVIQYLHKGYTLPVMTQATHDLIGTAVQDGDIGTTVQAYDATIVVDADIGTSVQGYDADTAKTDVAQTFTEPQRTTVEVGANALALTDKQTLSFTATAADITVASQTAGQAGTFRVLSSENITGWGAEFFWGTQGEPTGLTGTQVFSYEVFDASGADSIAIGIL